MSDRTDVMNEVPRAATASAVDATSIAQPPVANQEITRLADRAGYGEEAVATAVDRIACWVDEHPDVTDASTLDRIDRVILEYEERLGRQLDAILHHPEFQALEGALLGLDRLAGAVPVDDSMRIEVLPISRDEMRAQFRTYRGSRWTSSPLFRLIHDGPVQGDGGALGKLGGTPYGLIVTDQSFDHRDASMEVLEGLAKIACASHAVLLGAASPQLFGFDDWSDLGREDLDLRATTSGPSHARWRTFRGSDESRYVGLAMPRHLARAPHRAETSPAEFRYDESVAPGGQGRETGRCTWTSAAWGFGANVLRACHEHGWPARCRGRHSGGTVGGLPVHLDDDGADGPCMRSPVEHPLTNVEEGVLSDLGLLPLVHVSGEDVAVFLGGQSVHRPAKFVDAADEETATLSARLPYVLTASRIFHCVARMAYDWIGDGIEHDQVKDRLQAWLETLVLRDTAGATAIAKAKQPLADARVDVRPVPGAPGSYEVFVEIRPHYQLESMDVRMKLVGDVEPG